MSEVVKLTVKFTEDDIAAGRRQHLRASRRLFIYFAIVFLIAPASFFLSLDRNVDLVKLFPKAWPLIAGSIVGLIVLCFVIDFLVKQIDELMARWSFRKTPDFRYEYRMTFSDELIEVDSDHVHQTGNWTRYVKAWETKDNFMLFISDRLYQVIPKRVFQNNGDETRFRLLLKTKIPVFRDLTDK